MASPISVTDTVALTPTWDYFPRGSDGDFARLIPSSTTARQSFNRLVRKLSDDSSCMPHARRFIHFEDTVAEEEDYSSDASARQPPATNVVCGYYRLNMSLPPNNLRLGWVVGSGRPDLSESEVDFVLTPESKQHSVRGRHCRLYRNLQTGVLLIVSDGMKIILEGKDVLRRDLQRDIPGHRTQPESDFQRALHARTGIMIGDLSYLLEFTSLGEDIQKRQLLEAATSLGISASHSMLLSPTPLSDTFEYFDYVVYPVTHGGVSSTVAFAYSKVSGTPVVIKKMKRSQSNYHSIQMEINLLRSLSHVSFVCKRFEHRNIAHLICRKIFTSSLKSLIRVDVQGQTSISKTSLMR